MRKLIVFVYSLTILSLFGLSLANKKDSNHLKMSRKSHMGHHKKGTSSSAFNGKDVDFKNNTEVLAQIGGTAALSCHTQRMPDQLVTWMKRGDEQLLTAGLQVYSAEKRLSVAHLRHRKVWELRIRDVKASDAGTYDCQMTTHPPVSILVNLRVVVARAVIQGAKELHVHEGSGLRLTCSVKLATEPPLYVFWFHNETMVNFEASRPLKIVPIDEAPYGSSLSITNVSRADAGVYRCEPHKAQPDNVTLHVIAGENSAAMKRDNGQRYSRSSGSGSERGSLLHCVTPLIITYFIIYFYFDLSEGTKASLMTTDRSRREVVMKRVKSLWRNFVDREVMSECNLKSLSRDTTSLMIDSHQSA